jgi:hypothetical protein
VGLSYAIYGIEATGYNLWHEYISKDDKRVPTSILTALTELGELKGYIHNPIIKEVMKGLDMTIVLVSDIFSGNGAGVSQTGKEFFTTFTPFELTGKTVKWLDIGINLLGVLDPLLSIGQSVAYLNRLFRGEEIEISVIRPVDPNEIIGPSGYDSLKWVSVNQNMEFNVLFENDPDFATAPAQNVLVKVPVTDKLNMSDFRLGSFGFGTFHFEVPENTAFYTDRLDLRDSLGLYVDVTAGLNVNTQEAFWLFESIDPATGLPPANPMIGFLPVNDSTISPGPV